MADETENVVIKVSDDGTQQVTDNLTRMGQAGEASAQRITSALGATGSAYSSAAQATITVVGAQQQATQATQAATQATTANTAAQQQNTAAITAGTQAATQHATAVTNVGSGYSNLSKIIAAGAAYFSFSVFEKASDSATKIDNQLKLVTKSTAEFDAAYNSLLKTANASQATFGSVEQLFFNMATAAKGTTLSQQDLLVATDSVSKALFLQGTSAATTNRVMRDFSEAISQGQLNGRLFNAMAQQAPYLLNAMADALGVNRDALKGTSAQAKKSTKDIGDGFTEASHKTLAALNNDKAKIDEYKKSIDDLRTKQSSIDFDTAGTHTTRANNRTRVSTSDPQAQYDKLQASIAATEAKQKALQSTMDASWEDISATAQKNADKISAKVKSGAIGVQELIQALIKANPVLSAQAASALGTLSGAFNVLNNQLIVYVNGEDKANVVGQVLRTIIIGIANNLNILIPLVGAFVAAWALEKAITEFTILKAAFSEFIQLAKNFSLLSLINPWTIALAAVAAAVYLIYTNWDTVSEALKGIQPIIDATKEAWNTLVETAQPGITAILDALKAVYDFIQPYIIPAIQIIGSVFTTMVKAVIDEINGWINILKLLYNNFIKPIIDGLTIAIGLFKQLPAGSGATNPQGADTTSISPVTPLARNGLNMTIPGGGPTDSRLVQFMATPGERVIVQTPAQQRKDGLPAFRDGGISDVTSLGLSGVSINYVASNDNSLVGYNASTGAATSGTSAETLASIVQSLTLASRQPIVWERDVNAADYFKGVATATNYLTDAAKRILDFGDDVGMYYNAPTQSAIANGPSSVFDIQLKAAQLAAKATADQAAADAASAQTSLINQYWGDVQTGGDLSAADLQSLLAKIGPDPSKWQGLTNGQSLLGFKITLPDGDVAGTRGQAIYGSGSFGFAAPHGSQAGSISNPIASGLSGLRDGGSWIVGAARDGLDFSVPGAGAVDSRVLSLAVSPGEHVSVKTPSQKRGDNDNKGGGKHLVQNITIQTTDTDSYGRSRKQILRDLANRVSRAM